MHPKPVDNVKMRCITINGLVLVANLKGDESVEYF